MIWLHLLFTLAVNAIPAYGVFVLGWSVGVLLILFWFENMLGVALAALRLRLRAEKASEYLSSAMPGALAHGVFALALPFAFGQESPDNAALWLPRLDELRIGAALIALAMLLDLLLVLLGASGRSAEAAQAQADARYSRVIVLHLVIIFGAVAAAQFDSPYGMLAVMVALKTAVDVGTTWGQRPGANASPRSLARREAEAERNLTPDQRRARDRSR